MVCIDPAQHWLLLGTLASTTGSRCLWCWNSACKSSWRVSLPQCANTLKDFGTLCFLGSCLSWKESLCISRKGNCSVLGLNPQSSYRRCTVWPNLGTKQSGATSATQYGEEGGGSLSTGCRLLTCHRNSSLGSRGRKGKSQHTWCGRLHLFLEVSCSLITLLRWFAFNVCLSCSIWPIKMLTSFN
jgi:hypothetical protein